MINLEEYEENLKKHFDKLAIFDLDGTLYACNSHIEFLNQNYHIKIFNSKLMKLLGLIVPRTHLKILYWLYNKKIKLVDDFMLDFRESAIHILENKREEGFEIVIISNAPKKLIQSAANRLNVNWLRADIGEKDKVLIRNYNYKYLYVCTDNLTDINLLDLADSKTIYITNKTKKIFLKKYPDAQILEE